MPKTLFILLFFVLTPHTLLAEEELTKEPAANASEEAETEAPTENSPYDRGVFYGRIEAISLKHERISIRMVPEEFPPGEEMHAGRKTFYFDKLSRVRFLKASLSLANLELNQKVAVRYFSEEGVSVVDELFIIQGRYQPFRYKFRSVAK